MQIKCYQTFEAGGEIFQGCLWSARPVKPTTLIGLQWPHEVTVFNAALQILRCSPASFFIVFYCFVFLFCFVYNKTKNLLYCQLACLKVDFVVCLRFAPTTSPQSSHSAMCCFMTTACMFSQPCSGRPGVGEVPQMAGEWAGTGSETRHVCKSEDHQLLHSSSRAGEGSELRSQMVSKACANSMSVPENIRSRAVLTRLSSSTFWTYGRADIVGGRCRCKQKGSWMNTRT